MSSGVTDGWDDDDDVEIEEASGGGGGEWSFDDEQLSIQDTPASKSNNNMHRNVPNAGTNQGLFADDDDDEVGGGGGGEWSFDDEDDLSIEDDVEPPPQQPSSRSLAVVVYGKKDNATAPPPPAPRPPPPPPPPLQQQVPTEMMMEQEEVEDGWDNDDDLDLDEDGNDDVVMAQDKAPSALPSTTAAPHVHQPTTSSHTSAPPENARVEEKGGEDGVEEEEQQWSFDDEEDMLLEPQEEDKEDAAPPPPHKEAVLHASSSGIVDDQLLPELTSYLDSLPLLLPSLNAVLVAEYNTMSHATELCDYYTSRPHLVEYTLERELPRMDYEVVLEDCILRDKQDVYEYFSINNDDDENSSILIRCANQSLLPDILTVLTGPDLFIRPQYMATAMAQSCKFTLQPPDNVVCVSQLHLSLPSGSGHRLDVARLDVSIRFNTQTPNVEYRLEHVELLLPPASVEQLRETAAFLASMQGHDEAMMMMMMQDNHAVSATTTNNNNNLDVFRDAFLTQLTHTQRFVEATNTGFKSALKEIDAVVNVGQKLDLIKKAATGTLLPTLPTSEQIMEASLADHHDTEMTTTAMPPSQKTRGPPPPPPQKSQGSKRPPPPAKRQGPPGGQGQQATPPPPSRGPPEKNRPAPIIGGLLFSGLSRLAKTITVPDDENPSQVYEDIHMATTPTATPLHRKEETPRKLYRSDMDTTTTPPQQEPDTGPQLYRKEETPQKLYRQDVGTLAPPPPVEAEKVQDGWDDDKDDLDLDENVAVDTPSPVVAAVLPSAERPAAQPPAKRPPPPPPRRSAPAKRDISPPPPQQVSSIEYNEQDDIIETRTRWRNPRLMGRA